MLRILKLQIFSSLFMLFVLALSSHGQSKTINFVWEDEQNNESNGTLVLKWHNNKITNQWELQLAVAWDNASGEFISDKSAMPFIYLSEYDIEIHSDETVKCLNFSVSSNIYEIQFQDQGVLRFSIPPEKEKPGTLNIIFRYALSEKDIADANIDPIRIPEKQSVAISFPDTRVPEVENVDEKISTSTDTLKPEMPANYIENCESVRNRLSSLMELRKVSSKQLSDEDSEIGVIRHDIGSVAGMDSIKQAEFEQALQSHLERANSKMADMDSSLLVVRTLKELIDSNKFPADSLSLYNVEIAQIETDISTLRGEYVQARIQIRTLLGELGSTYADTQLAGMKKSLEDNYGNLFRVHVDSLESIQNNYSIIEPRLNQEIEKGPRRSYKNESLQSLKNSHELLKAELDSAYGDHRKAYFDYIKESEETGRLSSIETLHIRFDDIYGSVKSRMNIMDMQVSRLLASMNGQIIKPVPIGVIIGGIIVLFILLVMFTARLARWRSSKSGSIKKVGPKGSDIEEFSLIDDKLEKSLEYYKMKIPLDQQDMMVSEVHFHLRVIKSVYHLIQGALLEKKPENFGGLMFGRRYKVNGNGNEKSIVIVDRIVPAKKIRLDMSIGQEDGALLVDEIDLLVADNKKLALLGWFTSSSDSDNEMPENLVKVHRTYFREKWQIACLVYPGSDQMTSGVFVRRKSGFFDTVPPDGFSLSWDELYQFAVDPPTKNAVEDKKRPDSSAYLKIELNQNWCDSIVEHLFIHPDVLLEISTEKDNQIQMVSGQKANGFLYGEIWNIENGDEDISQVSFEVFINKFVLATSSENPRELPGSELLGWVKFDENEIFESLKSAIPYHEEIFKSPFQICTLLNSNTSEIRFFSRKHNLEMNNNTIETEEFNFEALITKSRS